MQKCVSHFHGSDCCDIQEIGVFEQNNNLSRQHACSALFGRADIRGKLRQMGETCVVLQTYENAVVRDMQTHNKLCQDHEIDKCEIGSTVKLMDALKVTYNESVLAKMPCVPKWPFVLPICTSPTYIYMEPCQMLCSVLG